MSWYATGTVAVTNGSASVVGTGTSWITNQAAIGGYKIHIQDSSDVVRQYEIESVNADGALDLQTWTYAGATEGGLSYKIEPTSSPMVDLAEQVATLIESSASLAGLVLFAKDIIQFDGAAFTGRTPLQYITDLSNSLNEVDVPSATTCDIGAALSPKVQITGAVTITSLGIVPNCLRFVRFGSTPTLTYNATSLILPGNANIVAAPNDTAIFKSNGAGNWRCTNYQRQATAP